MWIYTILFITLFPWRDNVAFENGIVDAMLFITFRLRNKVAFENGIRERTLLSQ